MNLFHLSTKRKLTIMAAVMASLLLAALDQTIVGTAMPRIAADLNGMDQYTWLITAYMLTSTITVPISGKLSDLFGRRPLLLAGIAVFVGGSMLAGLAQNMAMLIGFRALQGVGGGMLMSNTIAVVGDLFAPAERARWQGLIGGVFGLASVIGPLLGGWLTDHASWRWTFYINVPVGAVALGLILAYLPNLRQAGRQTIDWLGAILLSGALAQLVLALTWAGSKYAWGSVAITGLFTGAALVGGLFLIVERYLAKDPILPLDLFRNRTFNLSSIIMFLFGMAMFGAILYIPLFAQDVQGSSATNSGVILLPMVVGMMISSIGSGQLVARTGRYKWLAVAGMAGTTATIWLFSTMTVSTSGGGLAWRMVLAGLCMGTAMPIFNLIVQNAFPQERLGVVTAATQLFRNLGSTVGVAVMGSVMNSELTRRIGDLSHDHFVQTMIKAQPKLHLDKIDINKLQGLLMPSTITSIRHGIEQAVTQQVSQQVAARLAQLAQLPAAMRGAAEAAVSAAAAGAKATAIATANADFNHFIGVARTAIAGAISQVFLISTMIIAFTVVAALFLKEIPLRRGHETSAELAGAELAVELGDFVPEDEPELGLKARR